MFDDRIDDARHVQEELCDELGASFNCVNLIAEAHPGVKPCDDPTTELIALFSIARQSALQRLAVIFTNPLQYLRG